MKKIDMWEPVCFYELLAEHKDGAILKRLFELYPEQKASKKGYANALKELRKLKPTDDADYSIQITHVKEEEDAEEYENVDVYAYGISYALDLTAWERVLGYWVDLQSVTRVGEIDFIAHVLWEITWHGYSNKEVKDTLSELQGRVKKATGKK